MFSISIFILKNLYWRFCDKFQNNFTLPKVSLQRLQDEIAGESESIKEKGMSKQMEKNYAGDWN